MTSAVAEMPSIDWGSPGEGGVPSDVNTGEGFMMKSYLKLGLEGCAGVCFWEWKSMTDNIPQEAFLPMPCLGCVFLKRSAMNRKGAWQRDKCDGGPAHPLSGSGDTSTLVLTGMPVSARGKGRPKQSLLSAMGMSSMRACSRANSLYGRTRWKNWETKKSWCCVLGVQAVAAETFPSFTSVEGL